MTKTHWKNLANYDYLGAYSLDNVPQVILTIKEVKKERVTAANGSSEDCIVATFEETEVDGVLVKPMVFNKTNCKTIESLYGAFIEDWVGKRIIVFATTTKFARDVVPCLRIKKEIPPATVVKQTVEEEATCNCAVCGKLITQTLYDKSIKHYGVGVCSKECLDKYQTETNKNEEENK